MKSIIFCLFLLIVAVSALSSSSYTFSKNVSVTGVDKEDYTYRRTVEKCLGAGTYAAGAYFSSISIGRTRYSAEGDAIWGLTWIGNQDVPLNYLAYFDFQANLDIGTGEAALNVNGSAAFIASAVIAIEEHLPNGTVVATQNLKNAQNQNGFQWILGDCQSPAPSNPQISYATFIGYNPGQPLNVTLTNIVSNVLGVLSYANAVVSPKAFETIVQISNWPYQSPQNYLTLTLAVASAQGSADSYTYIYGTGNHSVYYSVGTTAVVDGNVVNVNTSGYTTVDYKGYITYLKSTSLWSQLYGRFGGNSDVRLITVSFPPNGTVIAYDPDTGAGSPVSDTSASGASVTSYGLIIILFSLLLSLF